MRLTVYCVLLLLETTASAQPAAEDLKMTQSMLTEVRQLRQDLQTAAATIQRVQIVMYRLQAQASQLDRATQRMEQARAACSGAQWQQKMITSQIEQAEPGGVTRRAPLTKMPRKNNSRSLDPRPNSGLAKNSSVRLRKPMRKLTFKRNKQR
jgi:hypothetical protein